MEQKRKEIESSLKTEKDKMAQELKTIEIKRIEFERKEQEIKQLKAKCEAETKNYSNKMESEITCSICYDLMLKPHSLGMFS